MNQPSVEETRRQSLTRGLAALGLVGIVCFVVAVLALHGLQSELSPLDEAMSYYVHGDYGWLITVALLALGVGSLAITVGVLRAVRGALSRAGVVCLAVWSIGVLLGGMFPADPPGNWDQPPSASGAIHGLAAVLALTIFPVAAVLLSRGFHQDFGMRRIGPVAMALAIVSAVSFVAFLCSLVPVMIWPGPPVLLGLTERILFVAYLAWLTVVALGLLRRTEDNL